MEASTSRPLSSWIVQDFAGVCSTDGTTAPCGLDRNVTGMVLGGQGDTDAVKIALLYGPPVMRVLWDSPDVATTFADLAQSITNAKRTILGGSIDAIWTVGCHQNNLKSALGVDHVAYLLRRPFASIPARVDLGGEEG
jgi:hypothetical protein